MKLKEIIFTSISLVLILIIKIVLFRIPRSYLVWQKLSLFKHGRMDDPAYAYEVFKRHYDRVDFPNKYKGYVMLEIGPGDSLSSAIIANTFNAKKIYLIDTDCFVTQNITYYIRVQKYLQNLDKFPPNIESINNIDDLLSLCNAVYFYNGLL